MCQSLYDPLIILFSYKLGAGESPHKIPSSHLARELPDTEHLQRLFPVRRGFLAKVCVKREGTPEGFPAQNDIFTEKGFQKFFRGRGLQGVNDIPTSCGQSGDPGIDTLSCRCLLDLIPVQPLSYRDKAVRAHQSLLGQLHEQAAHIFGYRDIGQCF